MPLDREHGETFGGLRAGPHVVIDPRILAGLTGYTSGYTPKRKFMTVEQARAAVELPVFDVAMRQAVDAFRAKGALGPIRFDETAVLVQVYPKDLKVAVTFQRAIAGEVYYATSFFDCPPPVLEALLAAAGKRAPAEH